MTKIMRKLLLLFFFFMETRKMKSFSWRRIIVFVALFKFQGKADFDSNCVSNEEDFVPQ